ncbi:PAS domain-containing sensor histidine kinase [Salinibaculum rarum]|uniref:PAS domain-containing sensor histidine kinase n=1 Tax=Salinibaculum rarum TaxID=3058903 RepID=UPI00265F50AA|nr:PAS domain-containing sensor histidine kinase [Salinibaculum sp. KK48]
MAEDGAVGPGATTQSDEDRSTVQLLVENEGNRSALRTMLADRYVVDTSQSVTDADLYLVEDQLFADHIEELRAVVERESPVFCPVVLLRRDTGRSQVSLGALDDGDTPVLLDDVIEAPVSQALLVRRLDTLLVRRNQAQRLQAQVSTLEARERELRGFKQAVEHSGHSITITDTDGTIQFVNSAFEKTTGYSASEAIGNTPRLLKSGEHDKEFYAELWGTILNGEVWDGEVINERKNGEQYVVEQTIAPILDDGDIEGFISVNSEVTERIRRKRELERQRQELDLLRQILTRVLRHNIRNDLNVVMGHAERLAADFGAEDDGFGKIAEKAKSIAETSETAREIADLIERSETPSQQDIAGLVRDVAADVQGRFPDTTVDVDTPEECVAYASGELRRAVTELVENAAEHNDADDPWVGITLEQNETIRLVVEDNGPGIPEGELVPLRRDKETSLEHGSSVSLWLVSWIVEQSDGAIDFERRDEGTRIVLELPRKGVVDEAILDTADDAAR